MRKARRLIGAFVGLSAFCIGTPANAAIHALVVGIDDYAYGQKLGGAVADAEDIKAALERLGIATQILRNGEASRKRLLQEWLALTSRVRAGDTIIFSYAGHGGSEPSKTAQGRTETAESFLLARFRAPRPTADAEERVLGKEIKSWFKKIKAQHGNGVRIIFVADSCHAGGLMRSAAPEAGVTYRSSGLPYDVSDAPIAIAPTDEATDADLDHVTFVAATQADKRIPEIVVDGRKRGALSYAFARALEGHAVRGDRGDLSNAALQAYITTTVRQLSEAVQTPEVRYRSGGSSDTILSNLPTASNVDATPEQPPIRLRLEGAPPATAEALKKNLSAVEIGTSATADLIWQSGANRVLNSLGDIVAEGIDAGKLQGVSDKWRALASIKTLVAARPLSLSLSPGDDRHKRDCLVTFNSTPLAASYVLAFNLAPDGSTQFVFPRPDKGDPAQGKWQAGEPYRLKLTVTPPFGADHLVVISSATPLLPLQRLLAAEPPANKIAGHLKDALVAGTHSIGLQSLYTEDKPCKS